MLGSDGKLDFNALQNALDKHHGVYRSVFFDFDTPFFERTDLRTTRTAKLHYVADSIGQYTTSAGHFLRHFDENVPTAAKLR